MRNELCLDNRNEPKWSAALQAADRVKACAVVYAAMFLPDARKHGRETDAWPVPQDVLPEVAEFFAQERQRVSNGQPGDLWRISNLDNRIRLVRDPYDWGQQGAYVERVLAEVNRSREGEQQVVVLLDPCNGIADRRSPDHPHFRISPSSVAALWDALRGGDILLVFQWADREGSDRARYKRPRALLQTSLNMEVNEELTAPPLARCFTDGRGGSFAMIEMPR